MPLDFLKRRSGKPVPVAEPERPHLLPEDVTAHDHTLKLNYRAKSSDGVRVAGGADAIRHLPGMLAGIARSDVELIEPLTVQFQQASPVITRPREAMDWINANHARSPVVRHALMVLELVEAADPAFETLALGLLHGATDTAGFPEFDAIVGGIASHWDEASGDLVVRAVVGWGGKGVRGDTDRAAHRILTSIVASMLASQGASGLTPSDRPMPAAGHGGLICTHCGFASAHERAFYCPKCGMRLLRA